jgi:ADP-ribose pyrophosphatase YjhB (NUDIX family)
MSTDPDHAQQETRTRANCIVRRANKILMVRHRHEGKEWWCLPGGRVEGSETPAEAAIRELREECRVDGTIVRDFSFSARASQGEWHAFLIDIGEQEPLLGVDPGFVEVEAVVDVRWMSLAEIPERDRAFLWESGLLFVEDFRTEVLSWGESISYPKG